MLDLQLQMLTMTGELYALLVEGKYECGYYNKIDAESAFEQMEGNVVLETLSYDGEEISSKLQWLYLVILEGACVGIADARTAAESHQGSIVKVPFS